MFGETPQQYLSPLEKNDHPELDDTKEMTGDEITMYLLVYYRCTPMVHFSGKVQYSHYSHVLDG
jgi:hypothetical protein